MSCHDLQNRPIHLGLGASASVEPALEGGMAWYDAYGQRHADDGAEGRLVSMYTFTQPWDSWEMHPHGSEVVICTAGRLVLHQRHADERVETIALGPGQYAINPPGVWHTADVESSATAIFITPGLGTENRAR